MHLMLQMGIYQDIYLMYMTFYFAFLFGPHSWLLTDWPTSFDWFQVARKRKTRTHTGHSDTFVVS